ncbi:MAG: metallophosphoesterase [Pseudomonadota bacterium]
MRAATLARYAPHWEAYGHIIAAGPCSRTNLMWLSGLSEGTAARLIALVRRYGPTPPDYVAASVREYGLSAPKRPPRETTGVPTRDSRRPTVGPENAGYAKHLVIADAHVEPGQSVDRWRWLARMAADRRPTRIVFNGDAVSLHSIGRFDTGKRCAEGRRFTSDVKSWHEAQDAFLGTLAALAPDYEQDRWFIVGNHENRIELATQQAPAMYGAISLGDLRLEENGWRVVPFLQRVNIDGIRYVHYVPTDSGKSAKDGMYLAANLLRIEHVTICVGHSHKFQYHWDGRGADRIHGIVCPMFSPYDEPWASPEENARWTRGCLLLHISPDGQVDPEYWSLDRMRRRYGG